MTLLNLGKVWHFEILISVHVLQYGGYQLLKEVLSCGCLSGININAATFEKCAFLDVVECCSSQSTLSYASKAS